MDHLLHQLLLLALVNAVSHIGKVITGVMMKTTIVDVHGMVEIAVETMLENITAINANVLTQKLKEAARH